MFEDFDHALDLIATRPLPGSKSFVGAVFSKDSKRLYYLFAKTKAQLSLYRFDAVTGVAEEVNFSSTNAKFVTHEEEMRRERLRIAWDGIAGFEVCNFGDRDLILLNSGGSYLVLEAESSEIIADFSEESLVTAKFAPSGDSVFASNRSQIIRFDLTGKSKAVVAEPNSPSSSIGVAEYIAQEELDRQDGFWVSPMGDYLAYCEVDETNVKPFSIIHQGIRTFAAENHMYPFAGEQNASVNLWISRCGDLNSYQLESILLDQEYIAKVQWHDSSHLIIATLDRLQTRLSWWLHDVSCKESKLILIEDGNPWINIPRTILYCSAQAFFTTSELSGYSQIVKVNFNGNLSEVTSGSFVLDEIKSYDTNSNLLYCAGWVDSPLERHLYVVDLDTGELKKCTPDHGWHEVVIAPSQEYFLDQFSNTQTPSSVCLRNLKTDQVLQLLDPDTICDTLGLAPPQIFKFKATSGDEIFGAIYLPARKKDHLPPIVISIYGGPHAQTVVDSWSMTVDLQAQYLASCGIAVISIDGRGSYGRGKKFEAWLHNSLGQIELEDQLAGVEYVAKEWNLDSSRLGIYGWSYGGFMTINALLQAGDSFCVGVAGAPVTDFSLYDTAYTERYMGLPTDNPQGYYCANLANYVDNLNGKLMIIHGMMDENVHFRNTGIFLEAAFRAQKDLSIVVFPEQRHMPRGFETLRMIAKKRVQFLAEGLGVSVL